MGLLDSPMPMYEQRSKILSTAPFISGCTLDNLPRNEYRGGRTEKKITVPRVLLIVVRNKFPNGGHPLNRGVEWVLYNQFEMTADRGSCNITLRGLDPFQLDFRWQYVVGCTGHGGTKGFTGNGLASMAYMSPIGKRVSDFWNPRACRALHVRLPMPGFVREDLDRDLGWVTICFPILILFSTFESGHVVKGGGLDELLEAWFQIVNMHNILSGHVIFLWKIVFPGGVNTIWVECPDYTTRVKWTKRYVQKLSDQ